jgi:hypothetical protein
MSTKGTVHTQWDGYEAHPHLHDVRLKGTSLLSCHPFSQVKFRGWPLAPPGLLSSSPPRLLVSPLDCASGWPLTSTESHEDRESLAQ